MVDLSFIRDAIGTSNVVFNNVFTAIQKSLETLTIQNNTQQDTINVLNEKVEALEVKILGLENLVCKIIDKKKPDPSELPVIEKIQAWQHMVDKDNKIQLLEEENIKLKKTKSKRNIQIEEKEIEEKEIEEKEIEEKENKKDNKSEDNKSEDNNDDLEFIEDGEEKDLNGEKYYLIKDEDNYIYKFSNYEECEIEELPCGQYIDEKINLFE